MFWHLPLPQLIAMRRIALLVIFTVVGHAQIVIGKPFDVSGAPEIVADSNWFEAYLPTGDRLKGSYHTMGDVLNRLGVTLTRSHSYRPANATVYFHKLTATPVVIIFIGKGKPERIQEAISSFDYTDYINSFSYYFDVRTMVGDGTLTKDYVQRYFPAPEKNITYDTMREEWYFIDNNLMLEVSTTSDLVLGYDVQNYKAMRKNQLAMRNYRVTGTDYSIGFNVAIVNLSSKVIKYVHFTATARDPVDDLVRSVTAKGIGPIGPDETGSFTYNDLIISRVAEYLSIDQIVVTYMDMSTKTISKKDVDRIMEVDWEEVGRRY